MHRQAALPRSGQAMLICQWTLNNASFNSGVQIA
jgi:hypothetical protein